MSVIYEGVLYVTVVEARNLAAMDKGGTSDPYCIVKGTFNKQSFKTSYTTQPTGHITIRIWDRDRWLSDDFLGEVAVPLRVIKDGQPVDSWFLLTNEPKKTKDKNPNRPPGELHLIFHFPLASVQSGPNPNLDLAMTRSAMQDPSQSVTAKYTFGKQLGKGGFSIVKEATNNATGQKMAIKIIAKDTSEQELSLLQREIDIMSKLRHNNIIQLIEVFTDDEHIYLVLELVTGGELFDQIISRGSYSERDAAFIIKQILEAVQYMHSNGIAHRDLKPENLLCSGLNNEIIKVTDFGLSKDFGEATLSTSCGTPDYVAPEVLKGAPYDNSVDIWSIGVITYILLCGFPPFYGNNEQEIFRKILYAEYSFPPESWDAVSKDAKDFIQSILILDPQKRLTAQESLAHPWMIGNAPSSALQTFKRDAFEKYKAKRLKERAR